MQRNSFKKLNYLRQYFLSTRSLCIGISLTNNVMEYRENFNEASKYPSIIIPLDGVKIIKLV